MKILIEESVLRQALETFTHCYAETDRRINERAKLLVELRTALDAAEKVEHDQKDVRCECCGYMTYHREHLGCIRAARPAPAVPEVPAGATHYQPHQKTYYKRVSATEWYLWSCTGKGWIESKGTGDSAEWVMLNPVAAPTPPTNIDALAKLGKGE